jgi:hypothetical protein
LAFISEKELGKEEKEKNLLENKFGITKPNLDDLKISAREKMTSAKEKIGKIGTFFKKKK